MLLIHTGSMNSGLNTTGAPNISGSLMLNSDGAIQIRPMVLSLFDLERSISTLSGRGCAHTAHSNERCGKYGLTGGDVHGSHTACNRLNVLGNRHHKDGRSDRIENPCGNTHGIQHCLNQADQNQSGQCLRNVLQRHEELPECRRKYPA